MQEVADLTIGPELAENRDRVPLQQSAEDGAEMLRDTQASVNSASASLSRKRQRRKLSVDEGLKAVQAAALKLEESFRLTDTQEVAIQKCFQLIKKDSLTSLNARVQREKSKRSLQVYLMLRNVREMLGLEGFLLCALALTPTCIQSMTEEDATNFPYKLKLWWESTSPSSDRLEAIARKAKAFDDEITHLPLADEMGKSFNLHPQPERLRTNIHGIPIFLPPARLIMHRISTPAD